MPVSKKVVVGCDVLDPVDKTLFDSCGSLVDMICEVELVDLVAKLCWEVTEAKSFGALLGYCERHSRTAVDVYIVIFAIDIFTCVIARVMVELAMLVERGGC